MSEQPSGHDSKPDGPTVGEPGKGDMRSRPDDRAPEPDGDMLHDNANKTETGIEGDRAETGQADYGSQRIEE